MLNMELVSEVINNMYHSILVIQVSFLRVLNASITYEHYLF